MGLLTESEMDYYLFSNALRSSSFGIRNPEHGFTTRVCSLLVGVVFIKVKDSKEKSGKITKLTHQRPNYFFWQNLVDIVTFYFKYHIFLMLSNIF